MDAGSFVFKSLVEGRISVINFNQAKMSKRLTNSQLNEAQFRDIYFL